MSDDSQPYKDTLLLPDTTFPMRGDLVKREPQRLEQWQASGLYERIQDRRKATGAPSFILHDGPPFANGDVHMGTALNKVLKDLVLRSKTMAGFATPFIPGWDCHGLPIEFKVAQEARDLEPGETRRRCMEFAMRWIDVQRSSFKRLGILGAWDEPYLTMSPEYEADIIRTFAALIGRGAVYQSKKPVQWSYGAHTALAEAEVEYAEKKSPSVFVEFPLLSSAELDLPAATGAVIWTTTPWTLPANQAIAAHGQIDYVIAKFFKENPEGEGDEKSLLLAKDLLESFAEKSGFTLASVECELRGDQLAGLRAQHPFLGRKVPLILANFVTTDAGTGLVHIAPGHGADDYVAGRAHGLEVLSPVDDLGRFTAECGVAEFVGKHVFDCNGPIIGLLKARGHLLGKESYRHSYPHCWRSKTPIIFRAVEQFFISLDGLREQALREIDQVNWLPSWGRNRIYGTVESRPDWCVSRQRTWGVPVPVVFNEAGEAQIDEQIALKVADLVEAEGSNVWFELSDEQLMERLGLPTSYRKCRDTLDVWIDSGSSHKAVIERHAELTLPADLYLEATDQHRGWFQSSLMLSVGLNDHAPYRSVMTHGFVVDQDKKGKLSKSEAEKSGKPIDAKYYYDKYGADIVRLWVSSVDWQNEVPFGENLFKQIAEPYRRLRNSLRILLGNMADFKAASQSVEPTQMPLLDRYILEKLNQLVGECLKAYEAYDFRKVFSLINQFCSADLSAFYVDVTKDRMYCDAKDSLRRRATQTVMHRVFTDLSKLLAPILVFTADEAWEHAGFAGSVHEQDFPSFDPALGTASIDAMHSLLTVKDVVQVAIEEQIQAKTFTKNNEARVNLELPKDHPHADLLRDPEFINELFIIAELKVSENPELDTPVARAEKTSYQMCPRCRRYEPLNDQGLCQRCADVLN